MVIFYYLRPTVLPVLPMQSAGRARGKCRPGFGTLCCEKPVLWDPWAEHEGGLGRLGRGAGRHARELPGGQSGLHGPLGPLPPLKNPPWWALPFQREFPELQMNFFVGCGEVRLCLLLYVIVLIMLNNFFQNASLWFIEDFSWGKSWDLE